MSPHVRGPVGADPEDRLLCDVANSGAVWDFPNAVTGACSLGGVDERERRLSVQAELGGTVIGATSPVERRSCFSGGGGGAAATW